MNESKQFTAEDVLERTERNGNVPRMYVYFLINVRKYNDSPKIEYWEKFCKLAREKYEFRNPPEEELDRIRGRMEEYDKQIDGYVNSRNNLCDRLLREFPLKHRKESAVLTLVRNDFDLRTYNEIISDIRGQEDRLIDRFISEYVVKQA